MKSGLSRRVIPSVVGLACGLMASAAVNAGGTLKIDQTKSITVGAGLRTSFSSVKDAAPSGTDRSKNFELDSIRLYINGQVTNEVKLTFNTERQADGTVRVLDGIAQFEFTEGFNIWAGRFLPPSDRSNLDGPYYLATWDFPIVQAYPAIFAGRDDGLAVWGQTDGGKFKYQVGTFEGRDGPGTSNQSDNLLYAGRLTFNLWDPEPGYYNSSTYYGAKEILAFGFTAMSQADGVGTPAAKGDFSGYSVDALMETKLNADVLSLEGAYYSYDTGVVDPAPPVGAGLIDGTGILAQVSYLLGNKVGSGKIQPHLRYQTLDVTNAAKRKRYDLGVNYIIDGHNARASFVYTKDDNGAAPDTNTLLVGFQVQI